MRARQLVMSTPTHRVRVKGLRPKQQEALVLLRAAEGRVRPSDLADVYKRPSEALLRLHRRGLLEREARGRYRVVAPGEKIRVV